MPPARKRDRVQEELEAIAALREVPRAPAALARLEKALGDKSSFVAAAAARLAGEAELAELSPALARALDRLLGAPAKADPGCQAKAALAGALYRNQADEEALFRRGLRHVQPEPGWGGPSDSAAELRGLCALALAQIDPPGVVEDLAELLADPEQTARALGARALSATGRQEALPALRLKLRLGDASGEVLLECYAALLSLAPRRALPVLAEVLDGEDEARREAAALALGQSRDQEALPLLRRLAERLPLRERRVPLLALSMLRAPEALAYLLDLVAEAPPPLGALALRALAVHRYDAALRERAQAAAARDAALLAAFREAFDAG